MIIFNICLPTKRYSLEWSLALHKIGFQAFQDLASSIQFQTPIGFKSFSTSWIHHFLDRPLFLTHECFNPWDIFNKICQIYLLVNIKNYAVNFIGSSKKKLNKTIYYKTNTNNLNKIYADIHKVISKKQWPGQLSPLK